MKKVQGKTFLRWRSRSVKRILLSSEFRSAAQVVRNRGLSGVGRILDNKEIACEDGLAGTGNRLVRACGISRVC
ncbi:MAG TPA: hypothetical protein DEG17_05540 [Cyanobacteria bacterium UBA11149]|nr:hypothetical protein [Cyanobacteria bacterium UBA11166]HBS70543.1 hypothetical protein [Cyanobacteria bacterium UBA11153]HBW88341.1 hypothetical protein [Cyanobacteria bacterium UBA11149]